MVYGLLEQQHARRVFRHDLGTIACGEDKRNAYCPQEPRKQERSLPLEVDGEDGSVQFSSSTDDLLPHRN